MTIEEIVNFFDTELIDAVKYLYSDHRTNYDKLYSQEILHSLPNDSGKKGINYEQHVCDKIKTTYNWDAIIKHAVDSGLIGNSNKIIFNSNKLNKLERKDYLFEKFKDIDKSLLTLVINSYYNYYRGSMFDLLFDPIWSLVSYWDAKFMSVDNEISKCLFDREYQFSISKLIYLSKYTRLIEMIIYMIISKKYTVEMIKKLIKAKYSLNNTTMDLIMYVVMDICTWGRYEGVFTDTDKEDIAIQSFIDLYRTSGTKFMYEI